MFQYITSDTLPSSETLSRYCLANPDFLLDVAETSKNSLSDALGDKFSLVMFDLRMGGAWKRTRRGRLKETERALSKYLASGDGQGIALLDIGASDGITTWEAVQALRQSLGVETQAWLADLYLYLLRYRNGLFVEYRAGDGEPVLARLGRIGLRLSKQRREVTEQADALTQFYLGLAGLREKMKLDARIPLIHPLAQSDAAITAIELNCLDRDPNLVGKFNAVRASNVLNHGYFTPAQIGTAVSHLHAYLRDGGVLVISRNNDVDGGEIECGSVWLRRAGHFEKVEEFGNGSEVREIVDAWRQ